MLKKFKKMLLTIGVLSLAVQFSALAESSVTAVPVKSLVFYEQMGEQYVSSYEIDSVILGRKVLIEIFSMNFNEDKNQAVTFVLDGQVYGAISFIGDLVKTYDQQANLKPMITVAIDYTAQQVNEGIASTYRTLDLTHVRDESLEIPQQAGAKDFLRFINEEVKPFVYSKYKTDKNDETLFGHSLGGLFSLYTLFTSPDSFDRYLIASPSIMWANKDILNLEEKYATEHTDMDKYLYFGVGENEGYMVEDMQEMVQRLSNRGYKNMKLLKDVYPGVGHVEAGLYGNWTGRRTLANEEYMTLPAWSSEQVFTKGQKVRYLGHVYEAKWWTQNEAPAKSSNYSVWVKVR